MTIAVASPSIRAASATCLRLLDAAIMPRAPETVHAVRSLLSPNDLALVDPVQKIAGELLYTRPVTNIRTWVRMKPGEELMEYFCMENNRDLLDGHLDHLRDATYRKYFGID